MVDYIVDSADTLMDSGYLKGVDRASAIAFLSEHNLSMEDAWVDRLVGRLQQWWYNKGNGGYLGN